jgi:hypothetical protein
MTAAALTVDQNSPLSDAHGRELELAGTRAKSIRKAARVAAFNGWTTAIIAALSAPFALFSWVGGLICIALAIVAYNELRGRRRLLAFDPAAATYLGFNQLGLLTVISVYCLWALYSNLYGASSFDSELAAHPEIGGALGSINEFKPLVEEIVVLFYGVVIALSVVFQGGNALYYFTRRKYIEEYLRQTPQWVIDVQRATAAANG